MQLTDEEIELLKTTLGNWKRIGVPTAAGDWLARSSIGELVKMGSLLFWNEEASDDSHM